MATEHARAHIKAPETISQEVRAAFSQRYGVELNTRNLRRAVKEMLFSMSEAAAMQRLQTQGELPFRGHGGSARGEQIPQAELAREIQESRIAAVAYLHPDGRDPNAHGYGFPLREPTVVFAGRRFSGERFNQILEDGTDSTSKLLKAEFQDITRLLSQASGRDFAFLNDYFMEYDPQELIFAQRFPGRYRDVQIDREQALIMLDVLGIKSRNNFVQSRRQELQTILFAGIGIPALELQEVIKNLVIGINPQFLDNPSSVGGFIREHIGDDYEGYGFTFVLYNLISLINPRLPQVARMGIAFIAANAYISAVEFGAIPSPIPQTADKLDALGGVFGSLLFIAVHFALSKYFENRDKRTRSGQTATTQQDVEELLDTSDTESPDNEEE